MRRLLSCIVVAALTGCAAVPRVTYTGTLTPLSGTCDPASPATLIQTDATVQFTPQNGVLYLDGTISPDGAVHASAETPGMDRKPYRLVLTAQRQADRIAGTYTTPRCRYAVTLRQIAAGG